MKAKLFALGNILMRDDKIAITIADLLEDELIGMGIEVIYGETDIDYCISQLTCEDYLIVMDASSFGNTPGKITVLSLQESISYCFGTHQHELSFIKLLHCYCPRQEGIIIAIEAVDSGFGLELSSSLQNRLSSIAEEVRMIIKTHCNRDLVK